jgi:hypothetical protein
MVAPTALVAFFGAAARFALRLRFSVLRGERAPGLLGMVCSVDD